MTIVHSDGSRERVRAVEGAPGAFSTDRALAAGDTAFVAAGDVQDAFGNVNGADSASVQGQSGPGGQWPSLSGHCGPKAPRFDLPDRGHPY